MVPHSPTSGVLARRRDAGLRRASIGAQQTLVRWLCFACAIVSVATTFGILWVLASNSFAFFHTVPLRDFLFGTEWSPDNQPSTYGVLPLVTGTLLITVGAGLIALPIGLLSAIFLSEYAHAGLRKVLKPALELLAGIPTVVYGYLAVFLITPTLKSFFPSVQTYNAASGAIVVGIMILPLVSSLCEDALTAVPKSLREAAYGLGSTKMEVILKIVVPGGLSGVMASFILALSRALGETMAVTLAAGSTPNLTFNPGKSIETMTAYIVNTAKGDAPQGTTASNAMFAVGVTLFAFTMLMNLLARRLVLRFRQVYT